MIPPKRFASQTGLAPQRTLFEEAEAIASMTNFDFHRIEDKDIDATLGLQIAIHKMVTGEVVIRYTPFPLLPRLRQITLDRFLSFPVFVR
jgi:hypothetical protein